jgi:hypothetical protein
LFILAGGNFTTLEWNASPYFAGGGTATFQTIFNSATGSITFNYGDLTTGAGANAASATVGIKGVSTFIQAGFNTVGTVITGDRLTITTVPEPGSMTLCGVVIAGGLFQLRRRKVA